MNTIRAFVGRVSRTDVDNAGVSSLQEMGGSAAIPSLNRLQQAGKRNSLPPKLGEHHNRRKALVVETIRSTVDTVRTLVEHVSRWESDNTTTNSLQEIDGSPTGSVSGRLHRTTNANVSRRTVIRTAGYAATAGAFGATVEATSAVLNQVDREQDATVSEQDTDVSTDTDHNQGTTVSYEVDREQHTILDGTQYETTVHTITSPNKGPTVMIFVGFTETNWGDRGCASHTELHDRSWDSGCES